MSFDFQNLLRDTKNPALSEETLGIAEAQGQVARLTFKIREAQQDPHGAILSAPGCLEGCRPCPRACATAKIQLNWWAKELTNLTGGTA